QTRTGVSGRHTETISQPKYINCGPIGHLAAWRGRPLFPKQKPNAATTINSRSIRQQTTNPDGFPKYNLFCCPTALKKYTHHLSFLSRMSNDHPLVTL
ncbi:hypothetical protein CEXT_363701, partial [Caerostris extrusa]